MAILRNRGVRLAGLAAAVPKHRRNVADEAELTAKPLDELMRLADSIGVHERRISKALCTSDLCTAAAARLLHDSGTAADEVDALIFVSQTADYFLPATACMIQSRLGLAKDCMAFDISLGCSGFVYGLSVLSSLMQSGQIRKGLLLCGDTIARFGERSGCHGEQSELTNRLLFGDAGSAALLVADASAAPMSFVLGTDGNGAKNLMVKAGACRTPPTAENLRRSAGADGIYRSDADLTMNGPEIFSFTLRELSPLAASTLETAGWTLDTADAVVMHQANTFMLKHLAKRLKIPDHKLVVEMDRWGNTSSASIPLAMVAALGGRLRSEPLNLLLFGFGVGYSWAGLALQSTPMIISELVEVEDDFAYRI